jgi:DNA repair protein SbcD/Mre11
MQKVKILHCADIHFDTPFGELQPDIAELRREELRQTFATIIKLAREEEVKLLLLCGDLFDSKSVTKTTLDFVIRKLGEIPEVRVFITPGNHDPYNGQSFYKLLSWPSNVHIFGPQLEAVSIEELNTIVYGAGFSSAHETSTIIKDIGLVEPNKINILAVHGDIVNGGQVSDYNAVNEEFIKNSSMDYIALGHRHSFSGINKVGKTYYAYSGCPEGRGFDELGPKGVIIGEICKYHLQLKFKELCIRKYIEAEVNISGVNNYEELELAVRERLGLNGTDNRLHRALEEGQRNLHKIILTGELSEDFNLNSYVVQERLSKLFFYVRVVDKTETAVDLKSLENKHSLKGFYVKKMKERLANAQDEEERQSLRLALKFGLAALDGKEVRLE